VINKLFGTSIFGTGIAAQNAAQQQANTQGYAQALAQAQNYQSQSPTALAQSYQSQSIGAMVQQGQQNATTRVGIPLGREGAIVCDAYPPATSMDLKHDAYETPVSTLIDLWVARYGNEWVDLETVDDDVFFSLAYQRLKNLGQLEIHYLTDRARYVCRKPK
jgi:hypothetical protein